MKICGRIILHSKHHWGCHLSNLFVGSLAIYLLSSNIKNFRPSRKVKDIKTGLTFKVNGQCLKHYWDVSVTQDKQSIDLQNT
ncbi:hypothetical protein EPI10_011663 [Gossypium australe]|uniref:Uncharacterized protein n=1 Tax=Gossypium australe TaxID=47621 RepID=A0A5B6WAF2_9ROSI|nr:hypothetical protein EPI10_011663 [Gossypium australe]